MILDLFRRRYVFFADRASAALSVSRGRGAGSGPQTLQLRDPRPRHS